MKNVIKALIFLISINWTFNSFGQNSVYKASELDDLTIVHQNRFDFTLNKFAGGIVLGELPMQIQFLLCKKVKDSLELKGQITDRTKVGLICDIFIATTTNKTGKIHYKIGSTDNKGNFNIKVKIDKTKSIYFTSISYFDLELKINRLNNH